MDSLANAVIQGQGGRQTPQRKPSRALWAKRMVGLAIVVSGGTLLASDLFSALGAEHARPTVAVLEQTAP